MKFVVTMNEAEVKKLLLTYVKKIRLDIAHSVSEECEFFDDGSVELTIETDEIEEDEEEIEEEIEEEDDEIEEENA